MDLHSIFRPLHFKGPFTAFTTGYGHNPPRKSHPGQTPPSESFKVDRIPPHTPIYFLLDFYL